MSVLSVCMRDLEKMVRLWTTQVATAELYSVKHMSVQITQYRAVKKGISPVRIVLFDLENSRPWAQGSDGFEREHYVQNAVRTKTT